MRFLSSTSVAVSAFVLLSSEAAFGHIALDEAGTHLSRSGAADIKQGPCGLAGSTRGTNVYTYESGATITVTLDEYIPHPGYFRIAFDEDGDDDFVDPQSVAPLNRECMDDPADHCGESDFYNDETVLPGMDNLNPHDYGTSEGTYTWEVELPNVSCDNCTLQIIQVMTDPPGIHAPYNPNEPGADDIYYQCIDLVLQGGPPAGGGDGGASSGRKSDSSGCSVAIAPAGAATPLSAAALAGLGLALVLRRRRAPATR